MARILYLHQYFHTPEEGGAIRSYYISQALKDASHEVIIITAHNHSKEEVRIIDGVTVHYLPVYYENNLSKSGRIISFIKFMKRSIQKATELHKEKRFDLCYATSTPLTIGIPARWMKFRFGVPYIFEVRDLWPEAAIQMGVINSWFWKWILKSLEFRIYKKAKTIIALSPGMKDGIVKLVPKKEVHLIPNMSDTDFFIPKEKEIRKPIQILYAGSLGRSNHLEYLLNAAWVFQKKELPVKFLIAGKGSEKTQLRKDVLGRKLSNVEIISSVNKNEIKALFEESDLIYISFLNIPILQTNSPNKFFDAIAAGKPCVINIEGWIADEIRKHEIGLVYAPDHIDVFEKFLIRLLENPNQISEMSVRARKLAEEKYSRKILCGKVVQLIQDILP